MAEKGFGVKEINLIGASGTPTITSPNNINLNAANVAISTNVSVGGTMTVTGGGSFGIGSTVGIGSTLYVSHGDLYLRDNHQLNINNDALTMRGNNGGNGFITNAVGNLYVTSLGDNQLDSTNNFSVKTNASEQAILATKNGSVALYHDGGNKKIETSSSGVTITGTAVATSFSGSGANLTGIAVTEAPVVDYTITANGSSAYRFHGGGVDETADDPDLYLVRGQKYRFNNTTGSSHPFAIREASGGSAYSNGVTGSNQGVQFFTVPYDAPAKIFYQCTIHSGMVGNIYIRGANGENENVGVTTFTDTLVVKGSGGGTLKVTGSSAHTSKIVIADNGGTANGNCLVEGGDGTDFFTIQSNGNIQFPDGKGINFGASAGGNASSSILDDYEEGTWTPNFSGLTASNTSNNCFYTKIGNLVNAQFRATMPSSSSASSATIAGLPFTIINSGGQGVPGGAFSETNGGENLSMIGNPNTTNMYVLRCDSSGVAVVSLSNISGKDFRGSITYRVS